eukprot:9285359-Pyramimonas_sp.AAC.1
MSRPRPMRLGLGGLPLERAHSPTESGKWLKQFSPTAVGVALSAFSGEHVEQKPTHCSLRSGPQMELTQTF